MIPKFSSFHSSENRPPPPRPVLVFVRVPSQNETCRDHLPFCGLFSFEKKRLAKPSFRVAFAFGLVVQPPQSRPLRFVSARRDSSARVLPSSLSGQFRVEVSVSKAPMQFLPDMRGAWAKGENSTCAFSSRAASCGRTGRPKTRISGKNCMIVSCACFPVFAFSHCEGRLYTPVAIVSWRLWRSPPDACALACRRPAPASLRRQNRLLTPALCLLPSAALRLGSAGSASRTGLRGQGRFSDALSNDAEADMLLKHSLRFSQGLCSFAMEASLAETTFDSVMLFAKTSS